jgi:hypothetical protein
LITSERTEISLWELLANCMCLLPSRTERCEPSHGSHYHRGNRKKHQIASTPSPVFQEGEEKLKMPPQGKIDSPGDRLTILSVSPHLPQALNLLWAFVRQ